MKLGFVSALEIVRSSKKTILLIVILVFATIGIITAISMWLDKTSNLHIPTLGNVRTLGVEAYWDENHQNKIESITWGTITPGSSQNVTVFFQSTSNTETYLHLNTTNWNPADISNYLSLSWDYNGTVIHPRGIIEVTLILSVSPSNSFINYLIDNNVKQFSFDIHISTSEYS